MTTRLYLDANADTVPISPTPDATWTDISLLTRVLCDITPSGEAMSTLDYSDAVGISTKLILFRQYISPVLTTGQAITGTNFNTAQCRISEIATTNNLFPMCSIRIIASDGVTVNKVIRAAIKHGTEATTSLVNRTWSDTASVSYTTQAGDRLCIEIGLGGTTSTGGSHSGSMRLGSVSGADLGENNTDTADNNPWVQLPDTLTFVSGTNFTDSENDGVTVTDAETTRPVSAQTDTVTLADASDSKTVVKALSDTVVLSDHPIYPNDPRPTDSVTLNEAATVSFQLALSDTLTLTDIIIKHVTAARSDVLLLSDVMTRSLHLNDTLTLGSAVGATNPDTSLVFNQLPAFFGTSQ